MIDVLYALFASVVTGLVGFLAIVAGAGVILRNRINWPK
jgi:hypothetical protein